MRACLLLELHNRALLGSRHDIPRACDGSVEILLRCSLTKAEYTELASSAQSGKSTDKEAHKHRGVNRKVVILVDGFVLNPLTKRIRFWHVISGPYSQMTLADEIVAASRRRGALSRAWRRFMQCKLADLPGGQTDP